MVALLSESGWRHEKTKKLRLRSLHQKGSRKLLDILVDLTLKELGLVNEDYLTIFNRARAVHERGDQEAHRIWRQTVKKGGVMNRWTLGWPKEAAGGGGD